MLNSSEYLVKSQGIAAHKASGFFKMKSQRELINLFLLAGVVLCMLFNVLIGTPAAAGILGFGLISLGYNYKTSLRALPIIWPWLYLGLILLLSTFWSQMPMSTFRGTIQYFLTILIAVSLFHSLELKPAIIVISICISVVMILSILFNGIAFDHVSQARGQFVGIYRSKNYLSEIAAFGTFISLAILADKSGMRLQRSYGLLALVLTLGVLITANSVGAILVTIPLITSFIFLTGFNKYISTVRSKKMFLLFALCLGGSFFVLFGMGVFDRIITATMEFFGKDTTLTGRTYLWDYGLSLIEEKPILGVGYQAFWRIGVSEAEVLWRINHVKIGSGFGFHNQYIHTTVETGMLGGIGLLAVIVNILRGFFKKFIWQITFYELALFHVFLFLLARSMVEHSWINQFTLTLILLVAVTLKMSSRSKS